MIEEQALVTALKGDQAIIQINRQNACQSCELSGACGTGSLGKLLGFRAARLAIENEGDFQVGDKLIIGMPEKSFVYAGFLIYLLPLLSLFAFALMSNFLFAATQWINVLAALLGLLSGLLLAARLSNNNLAGSFKPRVIRRELPLSMGETGSISPVN